LVSLIALSYFIYDTIFGFIQKYNDSTMIIHHLGVSTALLNSLFSKKYGSEMVESLFLAELSNPYLSAMNAMGVRGDMPEAKFNTGLVFMSVFVVSRLFLGTPLHFSIAGAQGNIIMKIMSVVVWVVSMLWLLMIANKASK
jgi:TLC domain